MIEVFRIILHVYAQESLRKTCDDLADTATEKEKVVCRVLEAGDYENWDTILTNEIFSPGARTDPRAYITATAREADSLFKQVRRRVCQW